MPRDITEGLSDLKIDNLQQLNINQIKKLSTFVDQKIVETKESMESLENERNELLVQIGNIVHESVPISDDEENNRTERTFGDVTAKKKYSHVKKLS